MSRTIRAGTRNYIMRIDAVSQEHVLVCITRKNNTDRKWHGSRVGIEIDVVVVWGVEIDLNFSVCGRSRLDFNAGIRFDLVLCGGRKWLGLESGSKFTWFSCRGACKIDLFSEWWSKLTWFQCWGRNYLGFVWGTDIDLVSVWGPKLTCFLCGVEIDLVLLCGSKISCLSVSMETDLVFVMVVKIYLISGWRIDLDFNSV